jgi:hypothetical protein
MEGFNKIFSGSVERIYKNNEKLKDVSLQLGKSHELSKIPYEDFLKNVRALSNNFNEWFAGFKTINVSFKILISYLV